uniref:Uncharacterized protein n=1 Tax=Salix viminalis TaxID=40686 RepID=A0A6N2NJ57_SALVM
MGIPAFYRWLTERYPLTIADVMEETPLYISGVSVPVDTSRPNPNGVEFDNLYLDMNGIIHPCFHPEGLPPPTTYEEVFAAVFKYIDRIFSIVRPRKLLFMAIDGVAPRAKMNQQRSRRFRAARDAACQALSIETNDGIVSESKEGNLEQVTKLDSNVITPGTEFMDLLSSALRSYIGLRMKEKLGWRGIKVILSDANVAGEGEHKIMSYIRLQRNLPGFDPNTRHCLYGLDADLIMLALASHEIHFSILREDHGNASTGGKSFKEKQRVMKRQKLNGDSEEIGKFAEKIENHISGMKFQFFNVWILREYLAYDMRIPDTTLKVDLERVIDDFVFMCLFVGNDFLPHIPSLEISEVFKYVEGICWVMRYYYEGVCSWQWFYPYHYAPFASDFYGCGQLEIHFTLGKPFKPFDQLMAVLPAARKLMMDASSPILDFYPTDFELDINGKRFSWQAICKLPFIEESRLVSEIAKVEHTLTDEERRRNRLGYDVLCVRVSHPLAVKVISLLECKDQSALPTADIKYQIDPTISGGMNGYIYISEKPEWLMTTNDQVISVFYEYPPFHSHIPRLPEGVILPNKSVTKWNCLHAHQLWHEPAVSSSVSSKRQIPKSISGPQLAKLAHRLVSEYSSSKHLDVHRCAEHGFPLDADRMGERRTEVQPKKRKRDKCNKDCLDGRSKECQVGKGDFVPINNAENMESSTLRQQGGSSGDYVSAGVDEIKVDKSKKRKWSSKDREHKEGAEGAGIPDGVQKLERSIQEQRNSDHTPGGADGENDYKEANYRKRKERNKKGNQNDGDSVRNKNAEKLGCTNHISKLQSCILQEQSGGDVHAGGDVALELKTEVKSKKRRKIEADGVVINNVEKLGSCFLMEQRGGDSTHTNADGLNATRNPVPNNNYQELEDGALELKTELKSKKRKKFVADGILINNVEKLGGSTLMEQRRGDSNLTNVAGLGATRSPVPNNIDQEFEGSGLREQIEHFDHSGANEVEIKPEIKSKRKKRRSKKKQQIELIVPTNDPLNLKSDLPGKEGPLDSNHIGAGGLEMKPEVNSKIIAPTNDPLNLQPGLPGKQGALDSNLIGLGGLEMKAEVQSKSKKRRSKKKRKIELIVPTNDPLNLQSVLPGNQGALDSNHIGAGGLEMKPEVNSKIIVPTNDPLNLQPGLPGKQGALDSNLIGLGGLEMKAEVQSKSKKRRSKKKRKIELIVPTNDPLNLQSGLPGNQGALDSNHIGAGGLEMKPEVNSKIIVPTNDPLNLLPGLPGQLGALDSNHIGAGGLGMKPEVNSKIIVPTNDPLNLLPGLPGQQGALDSNHIGVGGFEMKAEVKSKRKKRRSKKKQQIELIVPTNDPLNLKSDLPGKEGALDSNHIGAGGLEMKPEVNSKIIAPTNDPLNLQPGLPGKQGALDSNLIGLGGLEMKAEVQSKSKKRRSKKKRKIELIVPTNDPLNLQSVLPGNQGALDSNHIGAGGLEMKAEVNAKIIVPTNDPLNLQSGLPGQQGALDSNLIGSGGLEMKAEVNSKIIVPTNDPLNLQSGLPGQQGALDSNHIGAGGLEMKPEVNSKIIAPTNDPLNLQSGLPGQQGALDSNLIGVGGLGMKPEVKSKRKKRRSKKKQQTELIVPTNDPLNLKSGLPGIQGALDSNHIGDIVSNYGVENLDLLVPGKQGKDGDHGGAGVVEEIKTGNRFRSMKRSR